MSNPFDPNREFDEWKAWEASEPNHEPDSWAPIDLGPYLRGEVQRPQPSIGIRRSDGLRLIYPGKEHSVIGEMEAGKSWLLLASAYAELDLGRHVVYVHFEEPDPSDTVERLTLLGATEPQVLKMFRFIAPHRQVSSEALARLLDPVPSLVVFDGVNEAMSLHGWGIRDEDGAASFRRHLVMPCIRLGAATISADHVVKDREARGRHAIGSIHKGNGLSGSLILLENAEPFGRGARGRSHVFVTKDRPGFLRKHGRADEKVPGKTFMGELVVDDSQAWTPDLELKFWAPRQDSAAPNEDPREAQRRAEKATADAHVLSVVDGLISAGITAGLNAIVARSDYGKSKTSEALERLILDGALADRREGQQRVFYRSEQPVYRSDWSGSKDPGTSETGLASPGGPVDHPDHPDRLEAEDR